MILFEPKNDAPILFDFEKDAPNFKRRVWVRLQVGGIDLLGWENENESSFIWSRIWIHPFAPGGLICLVISKKMGVSSIAVTDDEGLTFTTDGDIVRIKSSFEEKEVTVKYENLFTAWKIFAEEVYKIVTQKQPEMRSYYYWKAIKDPYQYYKNKKIGIIAEPHWFEEDDGTLAEIIA